MRTFITASLGGAQAKMRTAFGERGLLRRIGGCFGGIGVVLKGVLDALGALRGGGSWGSF